MIHQYNFCAKISLKIFILFIFSLNIVKCAPLSERINDGISEPMISAVNQIFVCGIADKKFKRYTLLTILKRLVIKMCDAWMTHKSAEIHLI